jgi:hypothetical protein
MPQSKPGIATTILAPDPVGEGFVEISPNKTLFVQKLTYNNPVKPELVEDLKTVEDVFGYFKPSCNVELDKEDGSTIKEDFAFSGLGDFDVKSLINQSSFLKGLNLENDAYLKILKQLKSNKSLSKVIENSETRAAFISCLKSLVSELESNEKA